MSREQTIKIRQGKLKQLFLEQLKKTPTIEQSCQKVQVARMTILRWRKKSAKFNQEVEKAQREGREFVSDVAETQLFSLISDRKIEAIKYFLSHNNPRYTDRLELSGTLNTKDEPLTREQKALIREALKLSSIRYEQVKEITEKAAEKEQKTD